MKAHKAAHSVDERNSHTFNINDIIFDNGRARTQRVSYKTSVEHRTIQSITELHTAI